MELAIAYDNRSQTFPGGNVEFGLNSNKVSTLKMFGRMRCNKYNSSGKSLSTLVCESSWMSRGGGDIGAITSGVASVVPSMDGCIAAAIGNLLDVLTLVMPNDSIEVDVIAVSSDDLTSAGGFGGTAPNRTCSV